MATTMHSILFGEPGFRRNTIGEALRSYPERLSSAYASHYHFVLKVCRHFFWRQEDAEDAASEVFLKLHNALGTEDHPVSSRPWLSKVTGRHCIDKLRRARAERRRRVHDLEFETLPDLALSPLSRVLLSEEQTNVRAELRRLPRDYRVLLVLHYYRHMSYEEIASTLNRQLPAIKSAIFRAKRMLRERMLGSREPLQRGMMSL